MHIDTNECKGTHEAVQQGAVKCFLLKRRKKGEGENLSAACEWVRAHFWMAPMSREEMS